MSWTLIESQTLGSSVASVTLGNGGTLPQTYKTLKIVISARFDNASNNVYMNFNGSSTNFSQRNLYGTGTTAVSTNSADGWIGFASVRSDYTANTFSNGEVIIPNYSSSANKPYSADATMENNAAASYLSMVAGLWASSAAITSVTLNPGSGNFVANSTFTLYGLK